MHGVLCCVPALCGLHALCDVWHCKCPCGIHHCSLFLSGNSVLWWPIVVLCYCLVSRRVFLHLQQQQAAARQQGRLARPVLALLACCTACKHFGAPGAAARERNLGLFVLGLHFLWSASRTNCLHAQAPALPQLLSGHSCKMRTAWHTAGRN